MGRSYPHRAAAAVFGWHPIVPVSAAWLGQAPAWEGLDCAGSNLAQARVLLREAKTVVRRRRHLAVRCELELAVSKLACDSRY